MSSPRRDGAGPDAVGVGFIDGQQGACRGRSRSAWCQPGSGRGCAVAAAEGAARAQPERIRFDLITVSGKPPYAPLQGLRVLVRPAAGVHRGHEWPLYLAGEVVVG